MILSGDHGHRYCFDGGDRIQCADPVLSAQEDPALVGCDHRESFTGSEEPPGIVPVGMYGVGGNHRDQEYHGGHAAAVIAGGPSAVFWMGVRLPSEWRRLTGETVLRIRYQEKGQDGGWMAGPMMYLEKRLGCPRAAVLYGFFCIPAAFGMGSMVQANAISETVSYVYGIPEAAVG